jgi:hypothetical protein
MSKAVHTQRPLFDPWLDWNQLPESVREQALDVLTALYLEIVDAPPIGKRSAIVPQAPRVLNRDPSALPSTESATDDAPPH